MEVPKTMKAVVISTVTKPSGEVGRDIVVQNDVPVATLLSGMYRVKAEAVALNGTDWKSCYIDEVIGGRTGAIAGCDFAGTIVEVGPDVKGRFKVGDRVSGWTHGSCALHPQFGAFCEYVACDEHVMWKLPDTVSFESAATASVSISTAGLTLFSYNTLNFPFPEEGRVEGDFLVYGGGTSTGQILIQFAKRLGLRVITAAGQRNHKRLKDYGADVVVEYNDPDACIETIRKATNGELKWAYDGISEKDSFRIVHSSMSKDEPAKIVHVLPPEWGLNDAQKQHNIEDLLVFSYFALGREVEFMGKRIPADSSLKDVLGKSMELGERLAVEGNLKLQPYKLMPNGLAGIHDGYVIGSTVGLPSEKLVWKVSETPV